MIYHVLKDGSRVKDITGHVVKRNDAEPLYKILESISLDTKDKKSSQVRRRKVS